MLSIFAHLNWILRLSFASVSALFFRLLLFLHEECQFNVGMNRWSLIFISFTGAEYRGTHKKIQFSAHPSLVRTTLLWLLTPKTKLGQALLSTSAGRLTLSLPNHSRKTFSTEKRCLCHFHIHYDYDYHIPVENVKFGSGNDNLPVEVKSKAWSSLSFGVSINHLIT